MNENTGASAEMPRYRCHKEVWALKIKEITRAPSGNATVTHSIVPENRRYAPFEVSMEYIGKHSPQAGGYYVVYDDGYISYSPARAFEDGYRLIVRRVVKPTIEELEKILNGPEPDVTIEPDGTVTQGFADDRGGKS